MLVDPRLRTAGRAPTGESSVRAVVPRQWMPQIVGPGRIGRFVRLLRVVTGACEIAITRSAADAFDRQLRAALANTVWHTGCTSWYVDENGNDPNQWPWLWSTYRRRTARLDPGAYELAGVRNGGAQRAVAEDRAAVA